MKESVFALMTQAKQFNRINMEGQDMCRSARAFLRIDFR